MAPEPRDICWQNLSISFNSLTARKFLVTSSLLALVLFYMIPIVFVQSLANLDSLERVAPFLTPLVKLGFVKHILQGYFPGLALKLFLLVLAAILMVVSRFEGHIANSTIERKATERYYYFMLVNVFLGSIVTGTALQQLHAFLHLAPALIPKTVGYSIPMKATFFITYIMVDGWATIAGEILRLKAFFAFHFMNMFFVKTERDREKAMDPGGLLFIEALPRFQLYFLLGVVYAVVTPILLPFVLIYFALAYMVYRHQIINVYNQQYESAAAFWPHVHGSLIGGLLISQFLLIGLLSTKKASKSTPLLVILPIITLSFHKYCKIRFEPAFKRGYPLEEAVARDRSDSVKGGICKQNCMADAYLHPIFQSFREEEEAREEERENNEPQFSHPPIPDPHLPPISEPESPNPPPNVVDYPTSPGSPDPPPHLVNYPTSPDHVYQPPLEPSYGYEPSPPTHYPYNYETTLGHESYWP